MVTVGSLSYGIIANTENFTKGLTATKAELRDLRQAFLASQSPVEKFSTQIAHLEGLAAKFPEKAGPLRMQIASIREQMEKASAPVDHFSKALGRIGVVMDPVSAAFQAFNLATSAARAGLDAFESLANRVGDSMERLDELAKKSRNLGMEAADLVGLRRAAGDIAGVDSGTLDSALSKFGVNIGNAAMTGKGTTADALKRLGLDASELSSMGMVDKILAIGDALQAVQNNDERLALSKGILGKGGEQLAPMLAAGGDALRALIDDQNMLAQTRFIDLEGIESANDAMDRLGTLLQGLVDVIASDFAPHIEAVADGLTTMFGDATNEGESFRNMVQGVSLTIRAMGENIAQILSFFNTPTGQFLMRIARQGAGVATMGTSEGFFVGADIGTAIGSNIKETGRIANEGRVFGGSGIAEQTAIQAEIDEKAQAAAQKSSDKRITDWQKMQDLIVKGVEEEAAIAQKAQDKLIADKWKALQDWADLEDKTYKHNQDKADKIIDSQKNGAEKLRDDAKEVFELWQTGFLTDAQARGGLLDIQSKARDMLPDAGGKTVGAIRGGSVEALRQEMGGRGTPEKQLEEQRKIEENTAEAARLLEQISTALAQPTLAEAT